MRNNLPSLVVWLLISFAAAGIGAIASADSKDFYLSLSRPDWAPPPGVFGPVWSVLYVLIGVSAWLVWRQRGLAAGKAPYLFFFAQLAANALWTWLFFTWHRGQWAFFEILLLVVLIVATMIHFGRIKPLAAWLLAPYLAWVSFASALTFSVWRLNPAVL